MLVFLYNLFLVLYRAGIRVASLWNTKVQLWVKGRTEIFKTIESDLSSDIRNTIWIHCSSLGEFEQGRPLLESLKLNAATHKIVLTFFSPSGYEVRKKYAAADHVFYLPLDSRSNAKKFLDLVNPSLVIFVKYDYWYHYLALCHKKRIPLLMVSAIFREYQSFFKWYGTLHREMLSFFTHFFVQDELSAQLLAKINFSNYTISGDTRFDRVIAIAQQFESIQIVEEFCGDDDVLVAGSTWPGDEAILRNVADHLNELKFIIAPHDPDKKRIDEIKLAFPGSVLFSELSTAGFGTVNSRFLIIDNIGMLSSLYKYATISYVGGGLQKGIHNTLEAAVYGKPVLFGPKYEKFREAIDLVKCGGGFTVQNSLELRQRIEKLLNDKAIYEAAGQAAGNYVFANKGATEKILSYIQANRLLTN